ncbi:glutamate-5-semialdehyde dehydrogenase [Metabacillus idriensis]|uniref:glutamate-5-semialdehyde dehydrogenase n=1 Tax=Metabacillus idriensis TaxID=324768 RepID=UPI002040E0E1|nr:glutamate-5-semialdehyde dehydrogenase [Metabacillus idriensis]MCM3594993.1 glutamate-5-semialdehyde dehydrogenase [Metabacillus idriensis]
MSEVLRKGKAAKAVSYQLIEKTTEEKNTALEKIAQQLEMEQAYLIAENQKDLQFGKANGVSDSILDRMLLNKKRIEDMAHAIRLLIELQDPIGETLETIEKENGLHIQKKRVPLGVIGMIYEARPNVTIDAATLSLKTGNAVILRGSSSSIHSNKALVAVIHRALEQTGIPEDAVQLIEDTSRETAKELFTLNEYLDVLIPRGGKKLIDTVVKESTVPVLETGAGNCHIYIDESADPLMAERIVLNGKTQRPSVCNAIETILIHENWLQESGETLLKQLHEHSVEIFGDEQIRSVFSKAKPAAEEDWGTEYLALTVSIKAVKSVGEAIQHINQYGTKHSEAIITKDAANAAQFLTRVDAAVVYHNASTRFTDGFEFGYGAEIGISTQKLHARGPMGLPALTSSKHFIYGNGQIRE